MNRKFATAAAIGAVIGLAATALVLSLQGPPSDLAESIYDWANPVLHSEARIIDKSPGQWRIVMQSNKVRDCRLLEVQAYDVSIRGDIVRLQFRREDSAQPRGMPVGKFRSASYIVMPPPENRLSLSFLHECNGRTVRTPVKIKE